jgi:hypothetical protein
VEDAAMSENTLSAEMPVDADYHMAVRLEDECPWETCSKLWTHASWLDLIATIKALSPESYASLRRDLLTPPTTQG